MQIADILPFYATQTTHEKQKYSCCKFLKEMEGVNIKVIAKAWLA